MNVGREIDMKKFGNNLYFSYLYNENHKTIYLCSYLPQTKHWHSLLFCL